MGFILRLTRLKGLIVYGSRYYSYLAVKNSVGIRIIPSHLFSDFSRQFTTDTLVPKDSSCKKNLANQEGKPVSKKTALILSTSDENMANQSALFELIAGDDKEMLEKLKILVFELALWKAERYKIPSSLNQEQWTRLVNMKDDFKKIRYLSYLFDLEINAIHKIHRAAAKRDIVSQKKMDFHYYGLSGHSLFLRISELSLERLLNLRLLKAGLKVVFDCSYQQYMQEINLKRCAKQIQMSIQESLNHASKCSLVFCNYDQNDSLGEVLPSYLKADLESCAFELTKESYLKLFPKHKLVYLSPHADDILHTFNKDDIYIIGAFVDKGFGLKASLIKGKESNIRMARLPLEDYLIWKKGTKSLPLNSVLKLLLDMYLYNDWNLVFKNFPTRYILQDYDSSKKKKKIPLKTHTDKFKLI